MTRRFHWANDDKNETSSVLGHQSRRQRKNGQERTNYSILDELEAGKRLTTICYQRIYFHSSAISWGKSGGPTAAWRITEEIDYGGITDYVSTKRRRPRNATWWMDRQLSTYDDEANHEKATTKLTLARVSSKHMSTASVISIRTYYVDVLQEWYRGSSRRFKISCIEKRADVIISFYNNTEYRFFRIAVCLDGLQAHENTRVERSRGLGSRKSLFNHPIRVYLLFSSKGMANAWNSLFNKNVIVNKLKEEEDENLAGRDSHQNSQRRIRKGSAEEEGKKNYHNYITAL